MYYVYIYVCICICINSSLKQFEENENNIFFSVKMFLGKIEIL